MPRFSIVLVSLLVGVAGCQGSEPGTGVRGAPSTERVEKTEIDKLLDSRPTPDLTKLAERSAVGRRGKDAGEAFWDVLKLRETATEEAVPVLERILAEHANSTRIHGYAAAQALFYMDTPQAHSILSKHLLSPGYNARQGIRYTFGWDMDESKRDAFIERYHLKHLSKDMNLTVSATSQSSERGQRLLFSLVARNVSDKPFKIPDRRHYLGDMLYFRSGDGRFALISETVDVCPGPPKYLELSPGADHQLDIVVQVRRAADISDLRGYYGWVPKDASLVVSTEDVAYGIHQPGRLTVRAMFELPQPTPAQVEALGFDNLWSGRAVSSPVNVNMVTPSPQRTKPRP